VGDPFSGTCPNGAPVGSRDCWFNTTAFSAPATPNGTYGDVGRNTIPGPGAFTFDTGVSRKLRIREGKELALRFEAFNVLNHPVLANPTNAMNNANFGRVQAQLLNSRTLQAAAKFTF
jgi:hypothetical protein